MTEEQIEAVQHSAAFTMDEVAALELEEMKALYNHIIEPLAQKFKEDSPDTPMLEIRKKLHDDVMKLGMLLNESYFKIINRGEEK